MIFSDNFTHETAGRNDAATQTLAMMHHCEKSYTEIGQTVDIR